MCSKMNISTKTACMIAVCRNSYDSNISDHQQRFHSFPEDPSLRIAWVDRCAKDLQVCSKHFREEDFESSFGKMVLKAGAVPSLYLGGGPVLKTDDNAMDQHIHEGGLMPTDLLTLTMKNEPELMKICRVCASSSDSTVPIFPEHDQKINKFLPIPVSELDILPLRVCAACLSVLEACELLAKQSVQADATLRKILQEENNIAADINHKDIEMEMQLDGEESVPLSQRLATLQHHNNSIHDSPCIPHNSSEFSCWECGASVQDLNEFILHQKCVHARQLKPCLMCGAIFDTQSSLNKHCRETHPKEIPGDEPVEPVKQSPRKLRQKSPSPVVTRRNLRPLRKTEYFSEEEEQQEEEPINVKTHRKYSKNYNSSDFESDLEPSPRIAKRNSTRKHAKNENSSNNIHEESKSVKRNCSKKLLLKEENCSEDENTDEAYIPDKGKNSTYKCKVCSKGYESKAGRRNHYITSHSKYECKVCEELFLTSNEAGTHEKLPHKILCSLCPEYFQSQSSLKMHISSKHLEGPKQFKCSQCDRDYVSKSALMTHEKLHKIKEPSVCDVCNKCCKTPTALKYHKFVHMSDEEKAKVGFACTMCDKKFPGKTRLTLHMRRHTNERPCECPTCHKTFHDSERLKAHMEGHSTDKRFKCNECDACFVSKRYLVNHMYLSHRRRQVIRCVACKLVFPSMKDVLVHQKTHTKEELEANKEAFTKSIEFHCKECNEYFEKKDLLRIHKARFHAKERVPSKVSVPIKQQECKVCGKKVWGNAGLSRHMKLHTGDAPARTFQCEFCAKLFAQKMQMVLHIRTHTGEKPFRCQFCDKGFINVNSLVVHERIHTGENPFQCDKCPKAFRSNSNLVAHLQTHSDVKPYECHYCHKRFGRLIHLKLHLRTHTGERPYVCDLCGRAFTQGGDMRKHRLTHTGERAYKCDVCDFSSNKRKTLSEHQAAAHPGVRIMIPQSIPPDVPPIPQYPPPQATSSAYLKLYENWSEN